MCFRLRILVVVIIGITESSTERDIASFVIQLSVQLQGCIRRHTLVVVQRTAVDSIYTDTPQRVIVRIKNLLQIQPVIGVAHQTVRVGIERTALRIGEIVRLPYEKLGRKMIFVIESGFHSIRKSALKFLALLRCLLFELE